ncbi:hypothetical protein MGH68_13470 [Erysipelothrix sp. D19-032]
MSAHMRSIDPSFTGQTVYVKRIEGETYDVEFLATASSNIANHVRHFPTEWILPNMPESLKKLMITLHHS